MGDTGNIKRRLNKSSRVKRIVSLFEIPRPSKSKGLQRTNSLPATKRPSLTLSEEGHARNSLSSYYSTLGNVQRIKEEIEQKGKENDDWPKVTKKKTHSNRRKREQEDWQVDRAKIMEDINRLQERIEDVTQEIQNSDTELEITYNSASEKENSLLFEDCDRHSDQEVLRDKLSDEDSEISFNRLSNNTVINVSNDDMIAEDSDSDDKNSVSYVSYRRLHSTEPSPDESNNKENGEETEFTEIENQEFHEEADQTVKETSQEEDHIQTPDPDLEVEELNLKQDDDNPIQSDSVVETNSFEWWTHKSFVQLNKNNLAPATNETSENVASEEGTTGGRFIKNNRSKRNKRTERRRTGVLQKPYSVKELAMQFEGFRDAADNGETEKFRQSFIDEMDKELENMRNDGFKEDFHLSFENLTLFNYEDTGSGDPDYYSEAYDNKMNNLEDSNKGEHGESPQFQTILFLPNSVTPESDYQANTVEDPDDIFGETLFGEDLENGLYYVETYNADGKELIVCSVQIDRQSVDFDSFDEMRSKAKSNVLSNDDNTLVLMEAAEAAEKISGTDSKRTTIYSTTSGDSYEDEGIDIENASSSYGYSAARRETYCDNQGIVRIERVAPYPKNVEEPPDYINTENEYYYVSEEESRVDEEENYYECVRLEHEILFSVPEVKKETLQYILEEIKSTERKYVADMRKVLVEYKTFLEERCPEKVDVVFANMEQLYNKQLEFLQTLEESDADIKEVLQAFIDFEDLFRLYPRYFRNTPKANAAVKELSFLIKEKQDRINDKLDLSAYLLTPLQRLGKYKLFLENIIKQLDKEKKSIGAVEMALEIIKKYLSKGNDAVAISSILHSPLHTKDYGSFITREKFLLIKPKRLELMVFLFEGAVVFTTEDPKNMEQFVYHQSIKTNDLRIATFNDNTIHLTDYTKTKRRNSSKYTYILDAKNSKAKATWKQQIEEILWKQMQKIKENTIKEYQNGNKTAKKANRSHRAKSTGSSVFYVE